MTTMKIHKGKRWTFCRLLTFDERLERNLRAIRDNRKYDCTLATDTSTILEKKNLKRWISCGVNVVRRKCQFRADVDVFGPQQTRCIVFQGVPRNGRTAHSNSTAGYAGSIITYGGAPAPDSGKHNPLQGTIGYRVNAPRWVSKYITLKLSQKYQLNFALVR